MRVGPAQAAQPIRKDVAPTRRRSLRKAERTLHGLRLPMDDIVRAPAHPLTQQQRIQRQREQMEWGLRWAYAVVAFGAVLTLVRALWGAKPVAS